MKKLCTLAFALLLCSMPLHAQAPGEIVFWETVRDSKNPAELRAYLQRYPNGMFAPIAEARLAALAKPAPVPAPAATPAPRRPAPIASAAPTALAPAKAPQPGDSWTYRLTFPRRFGMKTEVPRTHTITIGSNAGGTIVDQLSIDGGTPSDVIVPARVALLPEGVSIFSPYLASFYGNLGSAARLGSVEIGDPACKGAHVCEASARILGTESVSVPAGNFMAVKVLVQQSWRAAGSGANQNQLGQMSGGRTLTIWYAPEVGRAVKYQSRLTVGDIPPIDAHFDLELISYQVK